MFLPACQSKEHRFLIGVSQCSDDEWRTKMNMEIMREAFMYDGVKIEIITANDNSKKQAEDIRYFINKNVDLLIVAPNEGDILTPIVEETYNNGIPVVVVDRKILSNKYTAYIGADNFKIGEAVGSYIASRYHGKGNVIEISGLSNSTPAIERHEGFMKVLNKYPEISVLCCEDAGWHRYKAHYITDSVLSIYPQANIVFAHNDRMAAGAYDASKKVGKQNNINFIGIDALPGDGNGVEMIQNKILDATFIYPTGGDKVLQTAMNILLKRPYEKETILKTAVIDSLNANIMMLQTSQISDMDKKVEMLNGKISNYLSQYATQQVVLYGSLLILFLVAGLLLIAYKALSVKNKLNIKLSEQKEQLENQYNQLVNLSQELEEATHAKLVFFTNISHDFRTPLTLVSDPVEQLLKDNTLNESQHKYLMLVKNNVAILLRLVNQILDFRKYENGKMELILSPVNFLQCIEKWNESFQPASRKKHIHFSFCAEQNIDYNTTVDIEKLERIYFNLLSNALKFTPENGKVTLTLSKVTIDNYQYHRLTILNTGSLITKEHICSIFERFYKIDNHHSGSGIGLALVKAFVEMHG
ncbi:MAG: substrate-binding domain-containing protein, partial [Muribaculaceae bacterium]